MRTSPLAISLLLAASVVQAAAQEEQSPFKGDADLAFNQSTGNTESSSLFARARGSYEKEAWLHSAELSATSAEADGQQVSEQYEALWQTNYKFSEDSYVLATARAQEYRYGEYDYRYALGVGIGHFFINEEDQQLSAEIGTGVSKDKAFADDSAPERSQTFAQVRYINQFTETTRFEQKLRTEYTSDNTYLESETNIGVNINSTLALKVGYIIKNNSDVSVGVEKTDTFTYVGLNYVF